MQGASSSSGFLIPPYTHDVFLSFRGVDTRPGFTYHLYKALDRENIKTFFDDRELEKGENITVALPRAIEFSKISVVILSENYASSSWCLDELVKILECKNSSKQQIVIPVFYKVSPSDVRQHQDGSFGEGFARLKDNQENKNKIPKWRAALKQVANLSGWTYVNEYESDFIDKIVKHILDVSGLNHQSNKKHLTGPVEQKKNIEGAYLYNQPVLEAESMVNGAAAYSRAFVGVPVQRKTNGADLYNQPVLEVPNVVKGADLHTQSSLQAENNVNGAELYNRPSLRMHRKTNSADLCNQVVGENKKELSSIRTSNPYLKSSNDRNEEISTKLPVDKAEQKKFFPKSRCDRHGDVWEKEIKDQVRERMGEMESLMDAFREKHGMNSAQWTTFQDNLHGADVHIDQSSLEVQNNLNGQELYNSDFFEVQMPPMPPMFKMPPMPPMPEIPPMPPMPGMPPTRKLR